MITPISNQNLEKQANQSTPNIKTLKKYGNCGIMKLFLLHIKYNIHVK